MKRLLQNTLAAACILVSGGALAADLPRKAPDIYAPALPGWSGWIVSGIVGGDWNKVTLSSGSSFTDSPSNVAFGGMSELIYMFNANIGVEHKLIVRYGNPNVNFASLGFGRGAPSVGAPYWRVDSFADLVFSPDPHWKLDAGVGAAAQTESFNIAGTGIKLQNYGWAANAGIEVKPFLENHNNLAFSVNFVYENMNGFQFGPTSTNNNNFGLFAGVGWEFQ